VGTESTINSRQIGLHLLREGSMKAFDACNLLAFSAAGGVIKKYDRVNRCDLIIGQFMTDSNRG
jgi:hypothetical protein